MLDPQFIRENAELVKQNTRERNMRPEAVDEWLQVDTERRAAQQEIDSLNRQRNELAEQGKQGGNVDELRERGKQIKEQSAELAAKMTTLSDKWDALIHQIPNIHLSEVPVGQSEDDNVELRKVGDIPQFDFEPKDHLQLGKDLDMLDFEAGAKVAGSQFYFLKNDAVRLEFALIQFGLDFLSQKGYTLVATPDLAKSRFYTGTGYMPRGDEAQIYEIEGDDLGLIGSAEITMAGLHADETFEKLDEPIRYAAISHCFRKEGGSYGKYSKGLYRVHQFTKLEMFIYCKPEQSADMHLEMLQIEEEIVQALGIPYRVLEMCTADLGGMAARKYDLEAWMPGRNDYGEITSTSNVTDFQARNLNIKYRTEEGKNDYVHMLNGTAIVMSRFPVAIMENNQQKDGTIRVPEVLVKYMGKDVIG